MLTFYGIPVKVRHVDGSECQQCGTPASPGAKYCESCGALLPGAPPDSAGKAQPESQPEAQREGAPAYAPPPAYDVSPTGLHYKGVGIRFVAILIDAVILSIITGIFTGLLNAPPSVMFNTSANNLAYTGNPLGWISIIISAIIAFLYFVLLEGYFGQTIGKMIVKIKVLREDGSKISYADAVVRTILRIIDALPYFLPYLVGAISIWRSDTRQRLGDRAAHTVVVQA